MAAVHEALVLSIHLLLSLVHSLVLLQIRPSDEVLAALVANVGSLAGVDSLVSD